MVGPPRNRGLAWTPDSAADVAKLRCADGVRGVKSQSPVWQLTPTTPAPEMQAVGSGKLPTPTGACHLAVLDKENLRLNMLRANPSLSHLNSSPHSKSSPRPALLQPSNIQFASPLLRRSLLNYTSHTFTVSEYLQSSLVCVGGNSFKS